MKNNTIFLILLVIIFFIIHTVLLAISQSRIPRETQGLKAYQAMAIVTTYLAYLFLLWAYYDRNGVGTSYIHKGTQWVILIVCFAFLIGFVVHSSRFVKNLKKEESKKLIYAHLVFTVLVYIGVLMYTFNFANNKNKVINYYVSLELSDLVEEIINTSGVKKYFQKITDENKADLVIDFLAREKRESFSKKHPLAERQYFEDSPFEKIYQKSLKHVLEDPDNYNYTRSNQKTDMTKTELASYLYKRANDLRDEVHPHFTLVNRDIHAKKPSYIFIDEENWNDENGVIQSKTRLDRDEYRKYVILHHIMHVLGYDDLPCDETTIDTKNNSCPVMYPILKSGCGSYYCGYDLQKVDFTKPLSRSNPKTIFL